MGLRKEVTVLVWLAMLTVGCRGFCQCDGDKGGSDHSVGHDVGGQGGGVHEGLGSAVGVADREGSVPDGCNSADDVADHAD